MQDHRISRVEAADGNLNFFGDGVTAASGFLLQVSDNGVEERGHCETRQTGTQSKWPDHSSESSFFRPAGRNLCKNTLRFPFVGGHNNEVN